MRGPTIASSNKRRGDFGLIVPLSFVLLGVGLLTAGGRHKSPLSADTLAVFVVENREDRHLLTFEQRQTLGDPAWREEVTRRGGVFRTYDPQTETAESAPAWAVEALATYEPPMVIVGKPGRRGYTGPIPGPHELLSIIQQIDR